MEYANWLRAQLRHVEKIDKHPEPQFQHYEDLRQIIMESRQRASVGGLPDAVRACEVVAGAIAPKVAREIIAACLAAVDERSGHESEHAPLTVPQAAKRFNINLRTLYQLCQHGKVPCSRIGKAIRIMPSDLQRYLQQVQEAGIEVDYLS
jgi:excisionase family DNA binding protein